jgi:hypothetical protein
MYPIFSRTIWPNQPIKLPAWNEQVKAAHGWLTLFGKAFIQPVSFYRDFHIAFLQAAFYAIISSPGSCHAPPTWVTRVTNHNDACHQTFFICFLPGGM